MSYSLIRARWKFGISSLDKAEEKFSYHLSDSDFTSFSRKIIMEGLQQRPVVKYKTFGVSEIHHVDGNLYDEVKKAHDAGRLGIWKPVEK